MVNARNILLWVVGIIFLLSVALNVYHFATESSSSAITSDTTRVTVYDTIPFIKPKPKDSVDIKSITERLPIADKEINFPIKDTTNHFKDTSEMVTDSNPLDSIAVEIPITQKVYEDSTYKAYVSGYKPSLDSIFVYPSKEVQTIKIKPKPKRWGIGVQVGYGLTLQPQPSLAPYVGVGISYNIFNF